MWPRVPLQTICDERSTKVAHLRDCPVPLESMGLARFTGNLKAQETQEPILRCVFSHSPNKVKEKGKYDANMP